MLSVATWLAYELHVPQTRILPFAAAAAAAAAAALRSRQAYHVPASWLGALPGR